MRNPRRRRQLHYDPSTLTLLDRLEYGAIAAFFGAIVGAILAITAMWMAAHHFAKFITFDGWTVWFSIAYFFVVGLLRGADAAEVIAFGLALPVLGASASADVDASSSSHSPSGLRSTLAGVMWSAGYFAVVAWRAWHRL